MNASEPCQQAAGMAAEPSRGGGPVLAGTRPAMSPVGRLGYAGEDCIAVVRKKRDWGPSSSLIHHMQIKGNAPCNKG